ncbi:MAG: hypothetical protein HGA22_08785, partial [Clostridiales bacterium]|nr:hypothetical protein [Clostridiales bacterium]
MGKSRTNFDFRIKESVSKEKPLKTENLDTEKDKKEKTVRTKTDKKLGISSSSGFAGKITGWFSGSLRAKLIAAFLVPVLLIVLQGILSYSNASGAISSLAKQSDLNAMESSGKYMQLILATIEKDAFQFFADAKNQNYLETVAADDPMKASLELNTASKGEIRDQINLIPSTTSYISNVSLITTEGKSFVYKGQDVDTLSLTGLKDTAFYKTINDSKESQLWIGKHTDFDGVIKSDAGPY